MHGIYIVIIYRNFIILYLFKICASIHQDADQVTPSNAKVVELPFASNAADPSKQETHLLQEMELNAVIATRILDDIFMLLSNKFINLSNSSIFN